MDASYNVHGTRSVQRLIQVCNEPDMVKDIMDALRGNIASLSSHSNGNHVIQRCLQHMPDEYRVDVFEEVVKSCMEVPSLSLAHPRSPRIDTAAASSSAVSTPRPRSTTTCCSTPSWSTPSSSSATPSATMSSRSPPLSLSSLVPHREGRAQRVRAYHALRPRQGLRALATEVQLQRHREDPHLRQTRRAWRNRQRNRHLA